MARSSEVSASPKPPWSPPPKGARTFQCSRIVGSQRQKCSLDNGDGVVENEFPLDDLDLELVRAWGPGTYQLQYFGTAKGGARKSFGFSCTFTLTRGADEEEPDGDELDAIEDSTVSVAPLAGAGDELTRALEKLTLLDGVVAQRLERERARDERAEERHIRMLDLVLRRDERRETRATESSGELSTVIAAIKEIAGGMKAMEEQIAELRERVDDDEDGGGDPDDLVQPGEKIGEALAAGAVNVGYRVVKSKGAEFVDSVSKLITETAEEKRAKRERDEAERRARTENSQIAAKPEAAAP